MVNDLCSSEGLQVIEIGLQVIKITSIKSKPKQDFMVKMIFLCLALHHKCVKSCEKYLWASKLLPVISIYN